MAYSALGAALRNGGWRSQNAASGALPTSSQFMDVAKQYYPGASLTGPRAGYRTPAQNAAVGGASDSRHMNPGGNAVDTTGINSQEARGLLKNMGVNGTSIIETADSPHSTGLHQHTQWGGPYGGPSYGPQSAWITPPVDAFNQPSSSMDVAQANKPSWTGTVASEGPASGFQDASYKPPQQPSYGNAAPIQGSAAAGYGGSKSLNYPVPSPIQGAGQSYMTSAGQLQSPTIKGPSTYTQHDLYSSGFPSSDYNYEDGSGSAGKTSGPDSWLGRSPSGATNAALGAAGLIPGPIGLAANVGDFGKGVYYGAQNLQGQTGNGSFFTSPSMIQQAGNWLGRQFAPDTSMTMVQGQAGDNQAMSSPMQIAPASAARSPLGLGPAASSTPTMDPGSFVRYGQMQAQIFGGGSPGSFSDPRRL